MFGILSLILFLCVYIFVNCLLFFLFFVLIFSCFCLLFSYIFGLNVFIFEFLNDFILICKWFPMFFFCYSFFKIFLKCYWFYDFYFFFIICYCFFKINFVFLIVFIVISDLFFDFPCFYFPVFELKCLLFFNFTQVRKIDFTWCAVF